MGISDVVKEVRSGRQKKAAQRLFRYLREEKPPRERLPLKVGDTVRASSLPYLCPREEVLASKYDIIRVEFVHPSMEITWEIGKAFHNMYRDVYYGPMREWAGAWKCILCGWDTDKAGLSSPPVRKRGRLTSKGKLALMPTRCGNCGAPFVLPEGATDEDVFLAGMFKEWRLVNTEIGLHGHPDGWSIRNGSKRVLVDLKSHGLNGFSARNDIREGHDLQVWGYESMTGDVDSEVWYLNKSPWGDPSAFVREVKVLSDKKKFKLLVVKPLEEVHNGVAGGVIPRRLCINADCARAKECQLVDVCFDSVT